MNIRLATAHDIADIKALQAENLVVNLTDVEKKNGFVTTPFTETQMGEVIAFDGLFVAYDQHVLAGYIFVGDWSYYDQWPIFPFMNGRFPSLVFRGGAITRGNSFQYGPICINSHYRGSGLATKMFNFMAKIWKNKYPIVGTFINKRNERSMYFHTKKLHWEVIDQFQFNDDQYYTLAIKLI